MQQKVRPTVATHVLGVLMVLALAVCLTPVRKALGYQASPVWIAYVLNSDIWVMDENGNYEQPLHLQGDCTSPTWSPDRRWLAFASTRSRQSDLYKVPITYSGNTITAGAAVRLTNDAADEIGPEWSPAPFGTASYNKVLFWTSRDGNDELYTVDADSHVLQRLTFTSTAEIWPSWSPDGSLIAFCGPAIPGGTGGNIWDIWGMPASPDAAPFLIWHHEGNGIDLEWSPRLSTTTSRIAFFAGSDVWTVDIDESGPRPVGVVERRLTTNAKLDSFPTCSPNGRQVAFHSDRPQTNIYKMDADRPEGPGNPAIPLTSGSPAKIRPAWNREVRFNAALKQAQGAPLKAFLRDRS